MPEAEKHKRISKIAYANWERLGRPIGQSESIWRKAEIKFNISEKEKFESIKKSAYYKWENEGRPQGRDGEFWKKAESDFYMCEESA